MRTGITSILILLACSAVGFAEEKTLRKVSWTELEAAGQLSAGEVESGNESGPSEHLKIRSTSAKPATIGILQIERPGVTASKYALVGQIRYEDVAPGSYLEMWSHFPDGKQYFTRTLASSGPLGRLEGTSDWRPVWLPFTVLKENMVPEKLEVNVVLTGGGTVYLSPLRLVESTGSLAAPTAPGQWWGERTGGWIGGLGGALIGILGGLIGTLAGLGKARRLVLGLARGLFALGLVALAAGVIALTRGQPYEVYYPLLLGGGIASVVIGGCLPGIRRRYEQIELRKMAAMDLGVSGTPHLDPSA